MRQKSASVYEGVCGLGKHQSNHTHTHTHTHTLLYIQRVPKKYIHILRDVIYVVCVYIFLEPSVYTSVFVYICVCVCVDTNKLYTHMLSSYIKKHVTMYADERQQTVNRDAMKCKTLEKNTNIPKYPNN
jgi:hypothetical protein